MNGSNRARTDPESVEPTNVWEFMQASDIDDYDEFEDAR